MGSGGSSTPASTPPAVRAGVRNDELVGIQDGELLARAAAPALDGRADRALCRSLARRLCDGERSGGGCRDRLSLWVRRLGRPTGGRPVRRGVRFVWWAVRLAVMCVGRRGEIHDGSHVSGMMRAN